VAAGVLPVASGAAGVLPVASGAAGALVPAPALVAMRAVFIRGAEVVCPGGGVPVGPGVETGAVGAETGAVGVETGPVAAETGAAEGTGSGTAGIGTVGIGAGIGGGGGSVLTTTGASAMAVASPWTTGELGSLIGAVAEGDAGTSEYELVIIGTVLWVSTVRVCRALLVGTTVVEAGAVRTVRDRVVRDRVVRAVPD
jgi:hypothetical protein